MKSAALVWIGFGLAAVVAAGDLASVKAEPNLERRSDKALSNADRAISEAREAYGAGDLARTKAAFSEVVDSVQLSYDSLIATGKNPRRSPKYFKRAEVATRAMMRRLKNLETDFSVDDRPLLAEAQQHLAKVHEDLLNGIMKRK
jgi:hypothetical protein